MSANKDNNNAENDKQKVVTKYDLKMERRKKEKEKAKREERIGLITGIVIVAALVCFVASFPIRTYLATHETYVRVNGEDVTRVEYDYIFNITKTNYINNYGSYMSYFGVNFDDDLSNQMYTDTLTWQDFFDEMAVDSLKQNKALLAQAKTEGFTYDDTAEYSIYQDNLKTAASNAGMSVGKYIKEQYGNYATLGRISEYIKESMFLNAFYVKKQKDVAPSDEEIQAYYDENKDTYDSVDYRFDVFEAELSDEPTDEEKTKAMADAKQIADAAVKTVSMTGEQTEKARRSSIENSEVADWLFDSARKPGDTTVIEDTVYNCYYVAAFGDRYLDNTPTVDARVLISDTEESASLLDEWKAGDATEDSFAALCNVNSLDTSTDGGLYEGLSNSSLDESLAAWLFDDSRQAGDTTVITISEGYTYIMYFVGQNEAEWKVSIKSNLTAENMSEYVEELSSAITVEDPNNKLKYIKVRAEEEAAAAAGEDDSETEGSAAENQEEQNAEAGAVQTGEQTQ